jgi:ABC-type thiamine transport system ATPase subunit
MAEEGTTSEVIALWLETAARMVGLDGLLERKPASLSGGQRQRVALARTIVSAPPLLSVAPLMPACQMFQRHFVQSFWRAGIC